MPNYTDSLGFNQGTAAYPDGHGMSKFTVELDFAKVVAARSAAGATALAAGDTMQVIKLPAGSIVISAGLVVTKVESTNTTATFDLGFTGGTPYAANVYADDDPSNALGLTAAALANPSVIPAADTIDLLINTAVPTDCVVKAFALVLNANA
jgi:type III secretory pathway component EscV